MSSGVNLNKLWRSDNVPETLSCWPWAPYYLPREFSHNIAIMTYIPLLANADATCKLLHSVVAQLETDHPQAFLLKTGNHASLTTTLPNFHQYVNGCTRENKTLGLLYANSLGAHSALLLPLLGHSDLNLVHLHPVYTPIVKKQPPKKRCVKQWSEEARDSPRDCFYTNWLGRALWDCTNFCVETTVSTKRVRCFFIQQALGESWTESLAAGKKRAFQSGDRDVLKRVQRDQRVQGQLQEESGGPPVAKPLVTTQ